MRVFLSIFAALGLTMAGPQSSLADATRKIASVSYDQHFNPTESVTFNVTVANTASTAQFVEVDVTLVNVNTGAETTLTPVLTGTVPAGGTLPLTHSGGTATYNLQTLGIGAGTYTVSFPMFDGDGVRIDRVGGKFPLHVGTETESIRVFPEVIHLGAIPPGRFMHPTPIEVSWSFFRFNRLRLDQPFSVRIYTDNSARYRGIPGAVRKNSSAGLVSLDGKYVIPLKIWNLNYGPDIQETGWDSSLAGPPPVDEDSFWSGPSLLEGDRNRNSAAWVRIPDFSEMTSNPTSWRRMIGQDPTDNRFVADSNATGDFTLTSPFTFYLATESGAAAVEGSYAATLIVELWSP